MSWSKIIIHKGNSHSDELVALSFALALDGHCGVTFPPVFRKNPTEEDLEDHNTLVLDVGMNFDPEKGNFDHHQRSREDEPECAASLFLQSCYPKVYEQLMKFTQWFGPMIKIDVQGPFVFAEEMGWDKFPFEVGSPFDGAIKQMVEEYSDDAPVDHFILTLLRKIGLTTLAYLEAQQEAADRIAREAEIIAVNGLKGVVYLSKDTTGLQRWRDELLGRDQNPIELGFSVTLDNRSDGYRLYRFNDHDRVSFLPLEEVDFVNFVHPNGFVATFPKIPFDEVLGLLEKCII